MKILISAYACDPTRGSEAACGWNWAYHTAKLGHEVWCITKVAHKNSILRHMEREKLQNLHFVFVSTNWLLEYARDKYHHLVVYAHYLSWQRSALQEARVIHDTQHLDLIHHVSYGSLQLGSQLWKIKTPFVFGPLSGAQTVAPQLQQYLVKGKLKEQLRLWFSQWLMHRDNRTRRTLRHTHLVLAANQETYNLVKKLGAPQISLTLDAGISQKFIPTHYPERPVRQTMRVLWLGRFVPHKGLSLVLEVFAALGSEYPIYLDVIGDGPLAHHYRRKVRELHLTNTVTFHGKLPFDALKQFYTTSDVFLFCGLRNSLGIQVLEAMAYGLPLVSLNQHGVKTFVPDNASINIELNEASEIINNLKRALLTLYLDTDQRLRRGKYAHQWAQQHTWDHKVALVSEYYQRSLSTQTSPTYSSATKK